MATEIKLRRGTKAQHDDGSGFTGAVGEITVDTTDDTLRVHDGSLKGGHVIAKLSDVQAEDTLAEMNDVNLTSPADGSLLKYDNASSKWIDSAKLTETSTGINVTGTVAASDGLTADYIDLTGGESTTTTGTIACKQIVLNDPTSTNDGNDGSDLARIYTEENVNDKSSLVIHSADDSIDEIILRTDNAVDVLVANASGINVTGDVAATTVTVGDSTGSNLELYEDGSQNAIIRQRGTGGLQISGVNGSLANDDYEQLVTWDADNVNLSWQGASGAGTKLSTSQTGVTVTGAITVSSTVDGRDIATDGTKLDTIESSADVTDTTNVVAALTAGTNVSIAGDGTISSTDTNTTYSVQDGELSQNSFTNDDHSKLNGIEASADVTDTANVVAALTAGTNIAIAGNGTISATDTNTTYSVQDGELSQNNFTDADHTKLNGIEASADVTDATNVVAALTAGTNIAIAGNGTISSTDTNTTFLGGTGLTLSGTTFNVDAAQTGITSVGTLSSLTTGATTVNGTFIVNNDFMELVSTTDNATEKPVISLYRNGGAAGPNDELGSVRFYGNDAGGEKSFFGGMYCEATGVADAQERGTIKFHVADGSISGNAITDVTPDISGDLDTVLEIDALGVRASVPIKVSGVAVSIDGVNQTAYRTGEIIEVITGYADGSTISGQATSAGAARNFALEDVTALQSLTTSYGKINGTLVNYLPPVGTKTLEIEYGIFVGYESPDTGVMHHKLSVGGTYVTNTRMTHRDDSALNKYVILKSILTVDGSGDVAAGNVDSWNSAIALQLDGREYGGSAEIKLHITHYYDGSTSGGNQVVVPPSVKITAIG